MIQASMSRNYEEASVCEEWELKCSERWGHGIDHLAPCKSVLGFINIRQVLGFTLKELENY